MKQLIVDFNSITDGLLRALQSDASAPLQVGEVIRLTDDEEHAAKGRVDRLEGDLAYISIDWDTWATVAQLARYGGLYASNATVTGQRVGATYRTRRSFGANGGWERATPNKGGNVRSPRHPITAAC